MVASAVIEKPANPGITHDTAARLIGIAPGELTDLVRDGYVHRNDKNSYSVPALVGEYCAYLRAEAVRPEQHPKQGETAAHLDLSDRSIREWETKLGLQGEKYTLTEFRIAYIRALREGAAGREAVGDLDLAGERAALAKAQRERIEMQNSVTRGELAPVVLIEEVLTKAASRTSGILDAIPGMVRRRVPALTADDIELIAGEVARARNLVAAMSLADLKDDESADVSTVPVMAIEGP